MTSLQKIRTIAAIILLLLSLNINIAAQQPSRVPATPHPIEVVQPNGDTLTIRLHGDERRSFRTTTDGYIIVQNSKGYYCFARINCCGKRVASRIKASNVSNRDAKTKRYLKKIEQDKRLKISTTYLQK